MRCCCDTLCAYQISPAYDMRCSGSTYRIYYSYIPPINSVLFPTFISLLDLNEIMLTEALLGFAFPLYRITQNGLAWEYKNAISERILNKVVFSVVASSFIRKLGTSRSIHYAGHDAHSPLHILIILLYSKIKLDLIFFCNP